MALKYRLIQKRNLGEDQESVPQKTYAQMVCGDYVPFEELVEENTKLWSERFDSLADASTARYNELKYYWEVKYDSGGRKQEEIYFGVDGRVKKNRNGVARIRFFRNGEGRVAKRLFLNEAGRPARNLEGIAACTKISPACFQGDGRLNS